LKKPIFIFDVGSKIVVVNSTVSPICRSACATVDEKD